MTAKSAIQWPGKVNRVHLIAVCGTAMGALACMLKEMGFVVTGSDQHVYPPMSDFLRSKEIPLFEGFKPEHLADNPDLVIVGNAVSKENAEVVAMQQMGLPFCSMPQAINRFAAAGKKQIIVTGTHGKTTTSSFIAWLLACAEMDPSFLIGGIVSGFGSNYRVGKGDWIILEGDEYDTAYFDKGPKFLHYTPSVAILTSVEFDHADIFRDLEHVVQSFDKLLSNMDTNASLVAYDSDDNIARLLPKASCRKDLYGYRQDSIWGLGKISIEPPFTHFEAYYKGDLYGNFKTRMIGKHNLTNLLAGIAVADHLQIEKKVTAEALATFQGVRRRQEVRGTKNGIVVIDDFAHHPTAVKATIEAVKSFYGDQRVLAIFEPRTNSSRRNVFQEVYATCFDAADLTFVRKPPLLEKIPEDERFSSARLVADLLERGKVASYFPDTEALIEAVKAQARPGDVLLIMSNGGFDNIHARLLAQL